MSYSNVDYISSNSIGRHSCTVYWTFVSSSVNVEQIVKRGEEIKLQYVKFIRTELGFEVIFQIAGQIILLLQSTTDTSTVNGLGKVQYV